MRQGHILHNLAEPWTWSPSLSTGIVAVAILGLAPLFGWTLAGERWIIFGALVMVALVPIIVRWPVVSTFGLYAFLTPFDTIPLLAEVGATTLTKPVGLLAGAVLVVAGLMERRLGRPPLAALFWGLFVAWGALSATWAIDPDWVLFKLRTTLSLFLLYIVAVSIRPSRSELSSVCLLAVLGGALAATVAYFFGLEEAVGGAARGTLVIGDKAANPNALGPALILALALAIAGVAGLRSMVYKAMALGLAGIIGVGMFISMSRSAVLGIVTMIAVLLYRLRVRAQILIAIVVLLALVVTMPDAFFTRMTAAISGQDDTGSGRTEIWKVLLGALDRFGIFGAGLWSSEHVYIIYAGPHGISGRGAGAHNVYLGVWIELGIIGLALMLAALGSHLLVVHRAWRAGRGGVVLAALEAGCFGILVMAFFHDIHWKKEFWLAWILLTWAVYGGRRSQSELENTG